MYFLNLGMWTQIPVILPVLTTSLILLPLKDWENVLFELGDVDPDTSYTSSSQYLTYTFTFERLGECTFWTWGCGPRYQLYFQFSLPHLYFYLWNIGRMYSLNLGMWTQIPVKLPNSHYLTYTFPFQRFWECTFLRLSLSKRTQTKEQSRTQATSFPPLHQTRKGPGNEVGTQALFPGVGKTIERYMMNVITLSLPRVINVKFPLQPHQKYYIEYEELGFL